jgi:hypothetical protein
MTERCVHIEGHASGSPGAGPTGLMKVMGAAYLDARAVITTSWDVQP